MLEAFGQELDALLTADPGERDTTLLVVTRGMEDFLTFLDLAARAERLVRKRLEDDPGGALPPAVRVRGEDEDDISNCTNRAPHPTLHLLREASIDRAVAAFRTPRRSTRRT